MSNWTVFDPYPYCPVCMEDINTADLLEWLDGDNTCEIECDNCDSLLEMEAEFDVDWRVREVDDG